MARAGSGGVKSRAAPRALRVARVGRRAACRTKLAGFRVIGFDALRTLPMRFRVGRQHFEGRLALRRLLVVPEGLVQLAPEPVLPLLERLIGLGQCPASAPPAPADSLGPPLRAPPFPAGAPRRERPAPSLRRPSAAFAWIPSDPPPFSSRSAKSSASGPAPAATFTASSKSDSMRRGR